VSERWSREQVLGLAPDAASHKAAGAVAKPAKWSGLGASDGAVWGECQGSGSSAYRCAVELAEPAFRCTCPSRKFPCKHALALLLLWSEGLVADGDPPAWAAEWLAQREARAQAPRPVSAPKSADPRTRERREQRVGDGLEEFGRWLRDQVSQGLVQAESAPYSLWDDAARRLVDAQAGTLAGQVKSLAAIPRGTGSSRWIDRLLEEYALLHLLTQAYAKQAALPPALRETVRARIGFSTSQDEVLTGPAVRDQWYVIGIRDTEQDMLTTRRVWLRGHTTGRSALVLSFAAPGRSLDTTLVPGTTVDASLAFFPGAQPLRALIATRHEAPAQLPPPSTTIGAFQAEYAAALGHDPWLDRWPALLADVRLSRDGRIVDPSGAALPLHATEPWRLLAVSGGGPITIGGEWTPQGLRALSGWHPTEGVVIP